MLIENKVDLWVKDSILLSKTMNVGTGNFGLNFPARNKIYTVKFTDFFSQIIKPQIPLNGRQNLEFL